MSNRLFKRAVALTIARVRPDSYFTTENNAVVISDLRVTFSIEKHLGSEPNKADVVIYNLAEDSRAAIQRKPLLVRLEAGYEDNLGRLFNGDLRWGASNREGSDWITKLQLADGDRAVRHGRVNRSHPPGTSKADVLKGAAKGLGLEVPPAVLGAVESAGQFVAGLTAQGPAAKVMTTVTRSMGMGWSIQDGRLQIQRANDVRPDRAILISQDTGMIGNPTLGAPKKPGGPTTLTIKMLLYPGLTPGGKIKVETRTINGIFKVERVLHTGDTHGDDWTSEIEARLL